MARPGDATGAFEALDQALIAFGAASGLAEVVANHRFRTLAWGRFITFEGGEGAGKSTQIARLAQRLKALDIAVSVTREPGGSDGAEIIRHILLSGAAAALGPDAEALLFAAARIDHVDRLIRPALSAGHWVLCDRFADSTRVYQGVSGTNPALIAALERLALDGLRPDLTVILDLPVDIGLQRATARRGADAIDRFEGDQIEIHEARRRAFLEIARSEPDRCAVIDGSMEPDRVEQMIWEAVRSRFRELALLSTPAQ